MERPWVVLKFGGTSVATAERWEVIAGRVAQLLPQHRVWVVASALAGVSNGLERAVREALAGGGEETVGELRRRHDELAAALDLGGPALGPVHAMLDDAASRIAGVRLTGEAPPRLVARIMAVGELASTRLGIAALARQGLEAAWVDARRLLCSRPDLGTEHAAYLEADVAHLRDPESAEREAAGAQVVLTQGFIARTAEGHTCLLGRGGSDTSAALFAALLSAARLEIWTDVHGLFTADPRLVPDARLICRIGYREAQELAAAGAKVLHPRCLGPVAAYGIPLDVRSSGDPEGPGTRVEETEEHHPAVTAVTCRRGVTLLTLSTLAMWEVPGFLARAFAPFDELGVSIDLVATSQAAVTVTLDRIPGGYGGPTFARLLERLEKLARVEVVHPSAVVSVVGRRIRAALHELGPAMEVFRERPVHLVSDSSEDLNLSFVVDDGDAESLVARLHSRLFSGRQDDPRLGPTWQAMQKGDVQAASERTSWWESRREELVALVADGHARYAYHLPTVTARAHELRAALPSVSELYYSMKANAHPAILRAVVAAGFGLECVSAAEVARAREIAGPTVPLLFSPNFCPLEEYAAAYAARAEVVVDGPEAMELSPATFRGREIGLRIDPGRGLGHHEKVVTAGARAKFGTRLEDVATVVEAARSAGARIVGLHAHVGSGIFEPGAWAATGRALATALELLPDVRWLDVGGGLGVVERPGQRSLDLAAIERGLALLGRELGSIRLRMEPGRYLVSEAGVLLAPVTQVRRKGPARFAGVATGMNSLLRPALYGAWHGIHNITRYDAAPTGSWSVVGPICESADVLGRDRLLPDTEPGDVLLIENAGAYGATMASRYNLREPAAEVVLEA